MLVKYGGATQYLRITGQISSCGQSGMEAKEEFGTLGVARGTLEVQHYAKLQHMEYIVAA